MHIKFSWTFSQTKWQLTSICFVLSWNTGFEAMCIVAWLSQNNSIGAFILKPKSCRRKRNHINSLVVEAMALYYASALEWAITFCFLLFQVTKFPPINVQYPVVNQQSVRLPAQSASVYPIIWVWPFFFIRIPRPGDPVKYWRILLTTSMWLFLRSCIYWLTRLAS